MKPKHEEHCRVMGWWPLWMAIDRGGQEDGGGGGGERGVVRGALGQHKRDFKPIENR